MSAEEKAKSQGPNTPRSATSDTIYELGSITKVFTSLLLADMVEHGEVALDDPVAKYLPHDVTVPTRGGKQITLADLATHRSLDGTEIVWTGGATYGSRTFAGYDPKSRVGVVVLSNYNSGSGIDDIGRHVLNARTPLANAAGVKPRTRTVSRVPAGLLDAYAGRYRFSNNQIWSVRRDGNRYFIKEPGEAEFEIFPEGDFEKGSDDFFSNSTDALFTFDFEKSSANRANQLTFSWAFLDPQRAERID